MLVPLVKKSWKQKDRDTIFLKYKELAKAQGQRTGKVGDIGALDDGEALWLHSHGSSSSFAGFTAVELAGWLAKKMPPGGRQVVLKGCRSGGFAKEVETFLRKDTSGGFTTVTVAGFEGEASQTSTSGEMSVRLGDRSEREKAAKRSALDDMAARQKLSKAGYTKKEIDAELEGRSERVEKESRTYKAVHDSGTNTFVALTPKKARLEARSSGKSTSSTTVPTSEGDEQMGSEEGTPERMETEEQTPVERMETT